MDQVQELIKYVAPFLPVLVQAGDALWDKVKEKFADRLAKEATEKSWEYAKKCWRLIRGKASAETLDALQRNPADSTALQEWAAAVERAQARDPGFKGHLQSIFVEGYQNQFIGKIEQRIEGKSKGSIGDFYDFSKNITIVETPPKGAKPLPPLSVTPEVADFVGREEEQAKLLAALRGGGRASI